MMIRCPFCHQDNPAGAGCCERCGAPLSRPEGSITATPELEQQIRSLLEKGYKIDAIKRYREQTGAGIREAKDAVEAIEQGRPFDLPGQPNQDFESELTELLQAGRKIEAIQLFRERTGVGLKQAKDTVEAIQEGRPFALPEKPGPQFENELTGLLQAGGKIEAIKLFRERTGAGLKEAKDAVERFAAEHGLAATRGTGCLNVLLLVAMLIIELLLA